MAGVGFLQSLCRKSRSGRAFGLTWIRWIVCVYAQRSMKWNVPGKFGPHGELFVFLIQDEPATVPVSPFFNAGIRTPPPSLFSADVLKKSALLALHIVAEEGRDCDGCHVRDLGGRMESGLPKRVQCGRVKAKLGRKTKVCPPAALVKAMCATMRCTLSNCMGLVARSLFS